jgi:hypothetical protein
MIQKFLSFQQNIRIYHWKSKNYNQHVTSGEFYEKLDELVDKFIELYLSRYPLSFGKSVPLKKVELLVYLKEFNDFLVDELEELVSKKGNSDLANLRDEMLVELNHYKYKAMMT